MLPDHLSLEDLRSVVSILRDAGGLVCVTIVSCWGWWVLWNLKKGSNGQ